MVEDSLSAGPLTDSGRSESRRWFLENCRLDWPLLSGALYMVDPLEPFSYSAVWPLRRATLMSRARSRGLCLTRKAPGVWRLPSPVPHRGVIALSAPRRKSSLCRRDRIVARPHCAASVSSPRSGGDGLCRNKQSGTRMTVRIFEKLLVGGCDRHLVIEPQPSRWSQRG